MGCLGRSNGFGHDFLTYQTGRLSVILSLFYPNEQDEFVQILIKLI